MTYFFLTRLGRVLTFLILGPRKFRLRGTENVPRRGPLLLVSNHIGGVDPALVGAWTPRPVWFMAKSELFQRWFSRWWMVSYHAFPVMRHAPDRKALRHALGLLARGEVVVLFPEGHRSDDAQLHRAEPGAGFIARRSGAPILALGITGTQNVLGRHRAIPRRVPVAMTFGHPFQLPDRHPDGTEMGHQDSADFLMAKIAELLPFEYQGDYKRTHPAGPESDVRLAEAQ